MGCSRSSLHLKLCRSLHSILLLQVTALEASVIRWLVEMGALHRNVAAQGFATLLPGLADGVFLPWLVQHLTVSVCLRLV